MEKIIKNDKELLKIKREKTLKKIKIGIYILFSILLILLTIMGIFVLNKYEFVNVKEKIIEKKIEIEKIKNINNYYIFISDKVKIEYTYNSNIYNQSFGNLYFFIKFNNLQKIFINKINGKELNKNIFTKDLLIDFDNKDEIKYEIVLKGKSIILSQKYLIQLNNNNKINSLNENIKIISVNGEKFPVDGITMTFGKFIEIIKNI